MAKGIVWNYNEITGEKVYKNAITNELFLMASAKLAWLETRPQKQKEYLNYAVQEYRWFFDPAVYKAFSFNNQNLVNSDYSINDGYKHTPEISGKQCVAESTFGEVWTYNQGVILGGLLYLYHDLYLQNPKLADAPSLKAVKTKLTTLIQHDLDKKITVYKPI